MPNENELAIIINKMNSVVTSLFRGTPEVILYGSYARGDATEGSDVDLMLLVDSTREEIAAKSWQVGDAAAELLMEHGVVVSPIVENRSFYQANRAVLPFFRNIEQEGVRMLA